MSDTLLPYYNRELIAIRKLAAEFADANPKIAGRLRLAADAVDDPHVARLLDFACGRLARPWHSQALIGGKQGALHFLERA